MLLAVLAPSLALLPSLVATLAIRPTSLDLPESLRQQAGPVRPVHPIHPDHPKSGKKPPRTASTFLTPHDIQGKSFISSYINQNVTDLRGVVTAKG